MNHQIHNMTKQQGSALIVSLTILLVLTILGVSAMQTTSLEERMAGNARDAQAAFEAAEIALRFAENDLDSKADLTGYDLTGTSGLFLAKGANPEAWTQVGSWVNSQKLASTEYSSMSLAKPPEYIIQVVDSSLGVNKSPETGGGYGGPPVKDITVFQVTARGYGISPNSKAMLQSYFGRID